MNDIQESASCSCLRSKSSYGIYGNSYIHLQEVMGATTTFWCLRTMGKAGPDEHYVHGLLCRPGRSCYQPREDEEQDG